VSERYAKGKWFETGRGTREKRKKKCTRSLGNMEKKNREEWT